ncbi:protein YIF1A-like [Gossypium australe]|uniref:Protein YIF1A-like n=1 Tax=Gossypium australe TaxID=47621 RepID=A0A5B6VGQ2_9ROSI|nr:protein YIF1A-like [Gossypium australe]
MNKLKLILFPFLHKGHWMRETETSTLTDKPPIDDVNAPDLYIPLMAFYVVLAGFFLGISGKQLSLEVFQCRFSPEALGVQATNGMLGWLFQVLLEATLPLLDVVAYGGYTFVAVSITIVWRTIWSYSLYVVAVWECLSMGMLLVKIIKRIFIAEVRRSEKHSSKRHYLLLQLAVALAACKYSTL